jgi:acyl carrier protein
MISDTLRTFVVREFLTGQDPTTVADDLPLISSGIIDSVGTLRLVLFLEESFGIEIEPAEIAAGSLDSIGSIAALVEQKQSSRPGSTDG